MEFLVVRFKHLKDFIRKVDVDENGIYKKNGKPALIIFRNRKSAIVLDQYGKGLVEVNFNGDADCTVYKISYNSQTASYANPYMFSANDAVAEIRNISPSASGYILDYITGYANEQETLEAMLSVLRPREATGSEKRRMMDNEQPGWKYANTAIPGVTMGWIAQG